MSKAINTIWDNAAHDDGFKKGEAFVRTLIQQGWSLRVLQRACYNYNHNDVRGQYGNDQPSPCVFLLEVAQAFFLEVAQPLFGGRLVEESWEPLVHKWVQALVEQAKVEHSLISAEWDAGWINGFLHQISQRRCNV